MQILRTYLGIACVVAIGSAFCLVPAVAQGKPAPKPAGVSDEKPKENDYDKVKDKDKAADDLGSNRKRMGMSTEEVEKIDKAIKNGKLALIKLQQGNGSFGLYATSPMPGYHTGGQALCLLTLVKCDVPREHEIIQSGKKYLRELYIRDKASTDGCLTYAAGVILMFLEAYYHEREDEKKPDKPGKTGARNPGADAGIIKIKPEDLEWIKELVKRLEDCQDEKTGVWGYPHNRPYGTIERQGTWAWAVGAECTADMSNTQYALLGLKAASRMGVKVKDASVYRKALEFLITRQDDSGPEVKRIDYDVEEQGKSKYANRVQPGNIDHARGWGYTASTRNHVTQPEPAPKIIRRTGAMTTAGIAAMVIARSEYTDIGKKGDDDPLVKKATQSIWDGFAWLEKTFTVDFNPMRGPNCGAIGTGRDERWHYYYLYGMERAGMIAGRDFFGDNEWYPPGAKRICGEQRGDGTWESNTGPSAKQGLAQEDPIADTCYALLFLKRATVPVTRVITGRK